jgi:parallel beta-helix repeat protein
VEPAAFFSYVRADDADGRLSEFRRRLSAEIRMQIGREFPIFQDREDILWGQSWKDRIESTLDTVTLLVPVLTPGFFASPACRDEAERFLRREQELGRSDLILPVYYVSTPHLDDPAVQAADPLAEALAARQFADWRELRFEPMTSGPTARALADLAARLRDTSWDPPTASRHTERPAVVSESELARPDTSRTAKVDLPTLVVDPWGRGDHTGIGAAVAAAEPGSRILVRPGLYEESLVVDKPLEIIGDGPVIDVVVHARGTTTLTFAANIGRITNLTLRQSGEPDEGYGLQISQGRLELTDCDISCRSRSGVVILGGADPRLRGNRVHDCARYGIAVESGGLGTLEDNDISANLSGVLVTGASNPTCRRNQFRHNSRSGILVTEGGLGIFEDNEVTASGIAGVEVWEDGSPALRRNHIHHNSGDGIHVGDRGRGLFEDNVIASNGFDGVRIRNAGNPVLRRNKIHHNAWNGVGSYDEGLGFIEDNDITDNHKFGVAVAATAEPIIRGNRIGANLRAAIALADGAGGAIEYNSLAGNKKGAWLVEGDASRVKRTDNFT